MKRISKQIFASLFVLAILGAVIYGTFQASVSSTSNQFASGTLTLDGGNGNGVAISPVYYKINATPGNLGATSNSCPRIQNTGSIGVSAGNFRIYAGSVTGTPDVSLTSQINVSIQKGTGTQANCSDFSSATTLYSGTLQDLQTNRSSWLNAVSTNTALAPGASQRFRITTQLNPAASNAVQGKQSGSQNIVWEVRSSLNNGAWTAQSTPANNWEQVAYGNGLYVAVASSGVGNRVMTSPDGTTWTTRSTPANNTWRSVVYGNGLFVAVSSTGTGNRVMTSPDGITWTSRTSAADNQWHGITYANGLFVATAISGTGNRVMTSPNGINWTIRSTPVDNTWYSVTYGNGLFVAVAGGPNNGNRVMTSPNGITWTTRSSAANNTWRSVTYGNGLFVAVASSGTGNRVMTSPDGITWTTRSSAADNQWQSVAYGAGIFVATSITGTGNRSMTSTNGITWSIKSTPVDNDWQGLAYGNGLFVSTATTGTNRAMTLSP